MPKKKGRKTIDENPLEEILSSKKASKNKRKTKNNTKTVLPAFGLADEILKANAENNIPTERRVKDEGPPVGEDGNPIEDRRVNKHLPAPDIDISEKFVTFFLDTEEYGLSIFQVQEINRVEKVTKVPNAPEYVKGVINLRGRIIPVIDLKKRLKLGECKIDRESRIVIIENGTKVLGLLVDRVSQVLNILPSQIEEAPDEVIQVEDNFVKGVGKLEDRMIILLDLVQLVEQESKTEDIKLTTP